MRKGVKNIENKKNSFFSDPPSWTSFQNEFWFTDKREHMGMCSEVLIYYFIHCIF